jgi:hypothetical protein
VETSKDSELLKQKIRAALEAAPLHSQIDEQYVQWLSEYLTSIASSLSIPDFKEFLKSQLARETSDYEQEELKWIRYRQSESKSIDDIVKRKDELARSIKEGKLDIDHVLDLAVQGDIESLSTTLPYFDFAFRRYQPSWWEKLIIFLLRRKIGTNPS